MTLSELASKITQMGIHAQIEQDMDGQIVIHTNKTIDDDENLIDFPSE